MPKTLDIATINMIGAIIWDGKMEFPKFTPHKAVIKLGAQNCYFEEKGAFTGEISVQMLKDLNCSYVILGHSERRSLFAETDKIINKKIKTVMKNSLIPILCVGESEEQRNNNITDTVIEDKPVRRL